MWHTEVRKFLITAVSIVRTTTGLHSFPQERPCLACRLLLGVLRMCTELCTVRFNNFVALTPSTSFGVPILAANSKCLPSVTVEHLSKVPIQLASHKHIATLNSAACSSVGLIMFTCDTVNGGYPPSLTV